MLRNELKQNTDSHLSKKNSGCEVILMVEYPMGRVTTFEALTRMYHNLKHQSIFQAAG